MTSTAAPHLYVACDLADGQTLVDWRRAHVRPRSRSRLRRLVHHLPLVHR